MYYFEINDLTFFINSLKHPDTHFNIKDFVTFSDSCTRSSSFNKLKHTKSFSNSARHAYFNRLPRLWNSLPPIDLDSSTNCIKSLITDHFWSHFNSHFNPSNPCTYHFQCPCTKCLSSFHATNFI